MYTVYVFIPVVWALQQSCFLEDHIKVIPLPTHRLHIFENKQPGIQTSRTRWVSPRKTSEFLQVLVQGISGSFAFFKLARLYPHVVVGRWRAGQNFCSFFASETTRLRPCRASWYHKRWSNRLIFNAGTNLIWRKPCSLTLKRLCRYICHALSTTFKNVQDV